LILRKISKIGATRRQILRLKCTKIDFSAGAPPRTPLGELTALPRPLSVLRGLLQRERRGKGKRGGKGKGGEGKNDLTHPLSQIPGYATG